MRGARVHTLLATALAGLAIAAAGCGGGEESPFQAGADTTPITPPPCATLPEGVAADGVNDEQGGSTPGVDPCDGPGN